MSLILPRRSFLTGLLAAFAAPAIVRATSLDLVRGQRFVLSPAGELTERLTDRGTLNYMYWVVQFGQIVKMSGQDILAAPSGTVIPPDVALEALAYDGLLGKAFRPCNEHEKGLTFVVAPDGALRLQNLAEKLSADPVILRLRKEQQDLEGQLRRYGSHSI